MALILLAELYDKTPQYFLESEGSILVQQGGLFPVLHAGIK